MHTRQEWRRRQLGNPSSHMDHLPADDVAEPRLESWKSRCHRPGLAAIISVIWGDAQGSSVPWHWRRSQDRRPLAPGEFVLLTLPSSYICTEAECHMWILLQEWESRPSFKAIEDSDPRLVAPRYSELLVQGSHYISAIEGAEELRYSRARSNPDFSGGKLEASRGADRL